MEKELQKTIERLAISSINNALNSQSNQDLIYRKQNNSHDLKMDESYYGKMKEDGWVYYSDWQYKKHKVRTDGSDKQSISRY